MGGPILVPEGSARTFGYLHVEQHAADIAEMHRGMLVEDFIAAACAARGNIFLEGGRLTLFSTGGSMKVCSLEPCLYQEARAWQLVTAYPRAGRKGIPVRYGNHNRVTEPARTGA